MPERPMEIPGYSIEREIGKGGMARVYLAVQRKFGRLVAIKVVSSEFTTDPEFGKRFVREARIVAQLTHPNIVQVHDAGVHDGIYFLVMEYLRGGDLNRRLQRGMHMQAVISVVKDVARGLDYAHQKGYVHRDIKPENILFREDGSAVVSDFGIARVMSTGASITRHGTVVGTPQYMSPEQAAGRELDGRSDIYSLGVVFFRMLTGDVPYKADSAVAVGIRHLQDPIPRLPVHLAGFQPIINSFLAKKPETRFQRGAEVLAALDDVRAEGVVPNAVVKSVVVSTAEIRAVTDSVPAQSREIRSLRVEADPSRRPRRRARVAPWIAILLVVIVATGGLLYPDREQLLADLKLAIGVVGNPELEQAWREAQSLRGDPNQSLASIVAGYRRVLSLDPSHVGANEAIAGLANQWKTNVTTALDADDLGLAEARLTEALAVFPLDEDLTLLFDRISDRKRAASIVSSTQALLRSRGTEDLPTVTAAIQSYQEALRLHPTNAIALAELNRLATYFLDLANRGADAGEITTAMSYIERAATADPKVAGLAELRDKIQRAANLEREIDGLLQQASAYRASGALLNPPGENAAEIYHRVLATDPSNAIASQGLSEVVAQLLTRATAYLDAGQIDAVRAMNARALEIGLSDAALKNLQSKLGAEEQRIAAVDRLLSEAGQMLADGYVTEPPEQNAVARLLEVLRIDPNNSRARDMLTQAANRLADVAREAYAAGMRQEARLYLELALTVTPDVQEWRSLRDAWASEAGTASAAAGAAPAPGRGG
jgi:tetratricopeptide (TPR) repeat protein